MILTGEVLGSLDLLGLGHFDGGKPEEERGTEWRWWRTLKRKLLACDASSTFSDVAGPRDLRLPPGAEGPRAERRPIALCNVCARLICEREQSTADTDFGRSPRTRTRVSDSRCANNIEWHYLCTVLNLSNACEDQEIITETICYDAVHNDTLTRTCYAME